MKYAKLFGLLVLISGIVTAKAADYPSESELWKVFSNTPGSQIHVNRVFIHPEKVSKKKLSSKDKAFNERNVARVKVRRQTLNRIWEDLCPGEKVSILIEKYDLFHARRYQATVITQRAMYIAEINEIQEKGTIFRKYELSEVVSANLLTKAGTITEKDGSCEIIDTTDYPAFISIRGKDGKWKTAVYVTTAKNWRAIPKKRKDYFEKTSGIMNLLDRIDFIKESENIPQVIIKK